MNLSLILFPLIALATPGKKAPMRAQLKHVYAVFGPGIVQDKGEGQNQKNAFKPTLQGTLVMEGPMPKALNLKLSLAKAELADRLVKENRAMPKSPDARALPAPQVQNLPDGQTLSFSTELQNGENMEGRSLTVEIWSAGKHLKTLSAVVESRYLPATLPRPEDKKDN
jgi:hypothetical protein